MDLAYRATFSVTPVTLRGHREEAAPHRALGPDVHHVLRGLQAALEQQLGGVDRLGEQQVELLALGGGEVLEHEVGRVLAARAGGRCRRAPAGSPSCRRSG